MRHLLSTRLQAGMLVVSLLGFLAPAVQGQTDPTYKLSDLIAAGNTGIVVGDKQFYGFAYQGQPAAPSDITVNTTSSPIGLQFNYTWNSTGGSVVDSIISYYVHTVDSVPQNFINGVGLTFNGTTTSSGGPLTNAHVTETVYDANLNQLGQLAVADFGPGNTNNQDSSNLAINPAQRTLFVRKDIAADSNSGGSATITFVDNNFSQTPEPASAALLGAGVLVLMARRRRVA